MITDLAKMQYKTGEIVVVDKPFMDEILRKVSATLGFSPEQYNYSFRFADEKSMLGRGINARADVLKNEFFTSQKQHEAVLFHEGIHYVMHKKGLLFGPSVINATFYDRLIDETVAELGTAQIYGYSNLMNQNIEDSRTTIDKISAAIGSQNKAVADMIKQLSSQMDFTTSDLVKKHRVIEQKYSETKNFETIGADVKSFFNYISSLDKRNVLNYISESVRLLAVGNAKDLMEQKVEPKDLVLAIADGVKNQWDSYGLYFYDVVGYKSS